MAKRGRKIGWRKVNRLEKLPLSVKILAPVRIWLETQDNQTATVENALIEYRRIHGL